MKKMVRVVELAGHRICSPNVVRRRRRVRRHRTIRPNHLVQLVRVAHASDLNLNRTHASPSPSALVSSTRRRTLSSSSSSSRVEPTNKK